MSNTKNLANLAAALDDGTSGQVLQSTGSGGVQFSDSSGSGVTVHANQAAMLTDAASADEGTLHYETGTNKLYVKQSSGFYLLASITNASPTIDSFSEATGGASANNLTAGGTFTLTAGSNTVITINATEPDLETISYSATVTSGTATDVFSSPSFPVTNQSSNVFTLTPVTSGSGGTVTIRFDASDGTNVANVSHSFEIAFVIADSHFTSLLMATDGLAGDNNDITDSSSSSHTITVNGDAHAGTFSPYRHGGYSTYFDGSGDWLELTGTALGNGNFTVEAWVWLDSLKDYNVIYDDRATGSSATGLALGVTSTGAPYLYTNNGFQITSSQTCTAKTWHHISLVRSSGVITIYLDGTSGGTYSSSANFTDTNLGIGVARTYTPTSQFGGYIRDVRAVVGSAITPASGGPTEPLTSVTNTSLLTCHLPYISDGSSNDHSITVNGDPETKPFGPYDYEEYDKSTNGGSVYFDGSGDWLTGPTSLLNLTIANASSQAATIEAWVYHKGRTSPANSYHNQAIVGKGDVYLNMGLNGSGNVTFYHYDGTARTFTSTGTVPLNTWTHVAATISGGTVTLYINGSADATTGTWYGIASAGQNQATTIGRASTNADSNYFNGYISDLRVIEGTATAPASGGPTAPLSAVTNTALLLSGTDAHVLDKSQGNNLKLNGTAASTSALTSGSTPPYIGAAWANTSAVSFDGNSDYVIMPQIPLGSGDFTIEAYTYLDARLTSYPAIFSNYSTFSAGALSLFAGHNSSTTTNYQVAHNGTGFPSINGGPITYDQWVHLCLERYNGTITLYKDGSSVNSFSSSASLNGVGSNFYIGATGDIISTSYLNGWIQDFRVTVGIARYQGAFTVPSAPLKG